MYNLRTYYSLLKAVLTKRSPFYVQFFITSNCFLKCKMCNIVCANRDLEQLDLTQIENIAKNLRRIGVGIVLLTGGEPFIREDIVDIVKIMRKHGLTPRLQTAGLLSKFDNMLKCSQLGAKDINVSLDTLDEDLGDYINGVKGSWRRTIQTIGKILREFPRHDTICALGCVLSPYNIDHVDGVVDFANAIGWGVSLVPAHINLEPQELHFRGYDNTFVFKKEDHQKIKTFIQHMHARKRNGDNIFDSKEYLDSIVAFIETNRPSWRYKGICDSPELYFAIRPDGSFAPCCDNDLEKKIYVYDDHFVQIYQSSAFKNTVREVTMKCPGCNFGSYPEMTLTCRHFGTFCERLKLQLSGYKIPSKQYSDDELFNIIHDIKRKYIK